VEIGLVFTCLTLATGSIWGRPTWGTWWTWDARLTTTLLLAVLQAAYLLLLQSLERTTRSIRVCSILGIVICVDIPIIYQSVSWWRSLHQPAALVAERGRNMDPEMLQLLLISLILLAALSVALWIWRAGNLQLRKTYNDLLLIEIAKRG
jgi:heme exporter protein C